MLKALRSHRLNVSANIGRLQGLRCVHTHSAPSLSIGMTSTTCHLRLDMMVAVEVQTDGRRACPLRPFAAINTAGKTVGGLPPVAPIATRCQLPQIGHSLEEEFARASGRAWLGEHATGRFESVVTSDTPRCRESVSELTELARADNIVVL